MLIDFENIEEKCDVAINSEEYGLLCEKMKAAKRVFLIGNGGLHYVASHMATDLSRLIPDKAVHSFDSVGFITSNANDHGYGMIFVRWLETIANFENPDECMVVGMSCSGNSGNVIDALHWAQDRGWDTFMISGQPSRVLRSSVDEVSLNCDYFHTVEVACMMLFYELIHRTGNHCPSIDQEKRRMSGSPLRKGADG